MNKLFSYHKLLTVILLSAGILLMSGCSRNTNYDSTVPSDTQIQKTDFCLDTVITITLNDTSDQTLLDSCFDRIRGYESLFSRTMEGSDVWKINHSCGAPVEVSAATAELLCMALEFSVLSDGAFDITIAPLIDLWNFTGEGPHRIPDQHNLESALSHVNYRSVHVDGTTVTLTDPNASIDLGGIAKGYIADRIREHLESQGITSGMIDLGGNLLLIGSKPDNSDWRIGIRRPFSDASDVFSVVPVSGQSVVTSGTYERYFEQNGTIYHHLLDPFTGYPADTSLASVTILTDSSAKADALSTACFVLGARRGLELIETLEGVEVFYIKDDLSVSKSSGFPG